MLSLSINQINATWKDWIEGALIQGTGAQGCLLPRPPGTSEDRWQESFMTLPRDKRPSLLCNYLWLSHAEIVIYIFWLCSWFKSAQYLLEWKLFVNIISFVCTASVREENSCASSEHLFWSSCTKYFLLGSVCFVNIDCLLWATESACKVKNPKPGNRVYWRHTVIKL